MKLSLCVDPGRPWSEAMTLARRVDAAGWHAVYQCDHFMPHHPDGVPIAGPVSECWTTLSALATVTSRVRLGSLVLGNTYRHPAVVASMAATLDQVSAGRVVLGVGAGWQPNEHIAYGNRLHHVRHEDDDRGPSAPPGLRVRRRRHRRACGRGRKRVDDVAGNGDTAGGVRLFVMWGSPSAGVPVTATVVGRVGGRGSTRSRSAS